MIRRLCALILMLACAFAPVLPAQILAGAEDCCCGERCPCPPTDCAPLPAAPSAAVPTNLAAAEQRVAAAKPAARVARFILEQFVSLSENDAAFVQRLAEAERMAPAASVALFRAHCSLLL